MLRENLSWQMAKQQSATCGTLLWFARRKDGYQWKACQELAGSKQFSKSAAALPLSKWLAVSQGRSPMVPFFAYLRRDVETHRTPWMPSLNKVEAAFSILDRGRAS
ncbi:unnamed protein product [Effrenium voratum]|uniref:Uncharacterized protein n=1 Tax=Effrenium voratum TaxID=2562239 RepID=A0AA36J5K4_9DINO|nr:unnamed protein product [Effrenium voratum]